MMAAGDPGKEPTMARTLLAYALSAALLLGVLADGAQAGKGSFSGGRSFGGGRSYSSGGRSFSGGKSFSSGGSSLGGGKSYSSGGSSFGGGKSYSSGSGYSRPAGGSGPSFGKPSSPSPSYRPGNPPVSSPAAGGTTYSSGSGASPGGKTSPAAPSRPPAPATGSPGGKSYAPGPSASRPGGPQRSGASFDSAPAAAQRRVESRAQFTKGQAPEKTYTDPKGTVQRLDPSDRRVEELRRQLNHEQWINRELRNEQIFRPYYSRPLVVYHDPYSSFFWWWLLDQNLNTQAMWMYNYRGAMDPLRYQDLLARNAELSARVHQLEVQGGARNPAYAPPGIDPDQMYTDSYVDSVYNPQRGPGVPPGTVPPPSVPPPVAPAPATVPVVVHRPLSYHLWHGLRVLLYVLLVLGVIALVIWLVFFKRWGATPG
jgi:hypothetical protein